MERPARHEENSHQDEYELRHWGLAYAGDAIAASGNLHGRPGYPEGIRIRTSVILSWAMTEDTLFLNTANSVYRCPLPEYALSGIPLSALELVQGPPQVQASELETRFAESADGADGWRAKSETRFAESMDGAGRLQT